MKLGIVAHHDTVAAAIQHANRIATRLGDSYRVVVTHHPSDRIARIHTIPALGDIPTTIVGRRVIHVANPQLTLT